MRFWKRTIAHVYLMTSTQAQRRRKKLWDVLLEKNRRLATVRAASLPRPPPSDEPAQRKASSSGGSKTSEGAASSDDDSLEGALCALFACVHTCVHMHVCVCVCACVCMWLCVCLWTCTCMCVCALVCDPCVCTCVLSPATEPNHVASPKCLLWLIPPPSPTAILNLPSCSPSTPAEMFKYRDYSTGGWRVPAACTLSMLCPHPRSHSHVRVESVPASQLCSLRHQADADPACSPTHSTTSPPLHG